jgi:signal transduction histidine kinase
LRASAKDYPSIRSWYWIDPKGDVIASSQSNLTRLNLADRQYFQELRGGKPWTISDILTDRATGTPTFVIARRVEDRKGALLGVMSATVEVDRLGEQTMPKHRAKDGTVAVFDRQGTVVYCSADIPFALQNWRDADPLLATVLQEQTAHTGTAVLPVDDQLRMAARVPLKDAGWVAGASRPVRLSMADVYTGLWIAAGLNLLVALASAGFAARTGGGIIRQLSGLQAHTQAIGRGNLAHHTTSHGVHELAELATAFNQMGDALRQAREQQERANAILEQRTVELAAANQQLEKEVAERIQAEKLIQQTADHLARSNEELEQFAYVASHDLQEPLRVVTGYVQLLERKYKDRLDADADQFIHYIIDGVTRMQQLIADLLNYSRVGSRGKPFQSTNVRAVLDRVLVNLQNAIEESGAVVTCDALPTVLADETQLIQLFQNLIGNGLKFRGGQPPRIHVSARREGDKWAFAVRDNGIGIERQYWDQIFVIFQRLHTRHKYPGTGIGLAICKRIVERHGGQIWLESQPGEGTTFHFTLR